MKLKEYRCPGCGAHLDIPEEKDEAVCEYCGQRFHIEREQPQPPVQTPVQETKGLQITVFLIFAIVCATILACFILMFLIFREASFGIRQYYSAPDTGIFDTEVQEVREEGIYTELDDIPAALLKKIHGDTEQAIADEFYELTDFSMKEEWHPKGVYFLTSYDRTESRLYDIYEAIFTDGTKEQTVYAVYCYKNVGGEPLHAVGENRTVFLGNDGRDLISGMMSLDVLQAEEINNLLDRGYHFTSALGSGY